MSYFEETRARQVAIQSGVIAAEPKNGELPLKLADATHAHASKFFRAVGRSIQTACQKNCSYCCHQPATLFPFEAFKIAEVLRERLSASQLEDLKCKLKDRVKGMVGSSVKRNLNNKTPCPLLTDDRCSIYENRPLTCRMAHSFSVKRCRQAFEGDRRRVEIPVSLDLGSGLSGILEGVFEELPRHMLEAGLYELSSALLWTLDHPEAATKWAAGDRKVFVNCIKDDT